MIMKRMRGRESPMWKIKISKFSHGNHVTKFRLSSCILKIVFMILIDGQDHKVSRHSRVLE